MLQQTRLHQQQTHVGMSQHVVQFVGRTEGIERNDDATSDRCAEGRRDPLAPVRHQHADARPLDQTRADQTARDPVGLGLQLIEAPATALVPQCRKSAMPRTDIGEKARQRIALLVGLERKFGSATATRNSV